MAEQKLSGKNVNIQVDETYDCHGFLFDSPSKMKDDFSGVTCLVGLIEQNTKNIRFEIVKDRSVEKLKTLF